MCTPECQEGNFGVGGSRLSLMLELGTEGLGPWDLHMLRKFSFFLCVFERGSQYVAPIAWYPQGSACLCLLKAAIKDVHYDVRLQKIFDHFWLVKGS